MKQLYMITIIASLLFPLNSFSLPNVQISASGVFSKTKDVGAEIVGDIQAAKNLSIAFGTRSIKVEERSEPYMPVFGADKYCCHLPEQKLLTSLNPGYGLYPDFYGNGATHLSGSVDVMGTFKSAPYAFIHSAKSGYTELGSFAQYRPVSTFNISVDVMYNRFATASAFNQIRKPVALKIEDDYYKKSKRQKNVGYILLGVGIALIGSSLVIAYHQKDAITGVVTIFYMGGPGIILSLASIPFFIASIYNKRKMMNHR